MLTTLVRPSHIVIYAPRVLLTCRLPATSLNLSIAKSKLQIVACHMLRLYLRSMFHCCLCNQLYCIHILDIHSGFFMS
ncbi:hypothetical protein C9426_30690 [Serratia sp. S1B]|nr:hypothetical protein C9426_30690 [Serratia sp. S1B]